jgi:hypothetical protein
MWNAYNDGEMITMDSNDRRVVEPDVLEIIYENSVKTSINVLKQVYAKSGYPGHKRYKENIHFPCCSLEGFSIEQNT